MISCNPPRYFRTASMSLGFVYNFRISWKTGLTALIFLNFSSSGLSIMFFKSLSMSSNVYSVFFLSLPCSLVFSFTKISIISYLRVSFTGSGLLRVLAKPGTFTSTWSPITSVSLIELKLFQNFTYCLIMLTWILRYFTISIALINEIYGIFVLKNLTMSEAPKLSGSEHITQMTLF